MLRSVLSVLAGYVSMVAFVMVTFSVAYMVLGMSGVFKADSYEPSGMWILISFILGLVGAVIGGFICAWIARGSKAPLALAGILLVLGLVFAIPVLTADDVATPVRNEDMTMSEAMQQAKQPGWVALLNPFVGAIGVMIGARLRGSSKT